jgi:hypothetical protein
MVIGRDFTFLETREAFPDGSCVLALFVVKCFDFFVVDMFASACLSSTLSHPQRAGACFCCLQLVTLTSLPPLFYQQLFYDTRMCVIFGSFVRGSMLPSGWILKPLKSNEWDVFYIAQINPMGWLPPAVVNAVCGDAALSIAALRKLL